MKYMDVGYLAVLLAHGSTGDVIRNKGEQSALRAPLRGRPRHGSSRRASTAAPHSGPPQGGVQPARGRLPGAKIGVSKLASPCARADAPAMAHRSDG